MDMSNQPLYHKNIAGGRSVKGVHCKKCGDYVGLVQAKSGKWYTCQLIGSMNPDSMARNAYPFMPHYKVCGQRQTDADAKRIEENAERLRSIRKIRETIAKADNDPRFDGEYRDQLREDFAPVLKSLADKMYRDGFDPETGEAL